MSSARRIEAWTISFGSVRVDAIAPTPFVTAVPISRCGACRAGTKRDRFSHATVSRMGHADTIYRPCTGSHARRLVVERHGSVGKDVRRWTAPVFALGAGLRVSAVDWRRMGRGYARRAGVRPARDLAGSAGTARRRLADFLRRPRRVFFGHSLGGARHGGAHRRSLGFPAGRSGAAFRTVIRRGAGRMGRVLRLGREGGAARHDLRAVTVQRRWFQDTARVRHEARKRRAPCSVEPRRSFCSNATPFEGNGGRDRD